MAPLLRACKGFFGFGEPVVRGEQHRERERSIGDAPLVGPAVGRRSPRDLAAFLEQHPEVVSGGRMAPLVGARQPQLGFGEPVLTSEQHRELERGVGISALVGAVIGSRGLGDLAAFFEHRAEVVGGGGVAALVRAGKRAFGFIQPVLLSQQDRELECAIRVAAVVGATICGGGAGDITALFEQHAEVVGGGGVAALVRAR